MKYKSGYKHQLVESEVFSTAFKPDRYIDTRFIKLKTTGELTIIKSYAWDGVSGPVMDRKTNMRASLCHDSLYQLMRMGLLNSERWREADLEFAKILKEDGAWSITIKIDMIGLRMAGGKAARPSNAKKIKSAP